jgi:ELWxxDGT repeat protein
VRRAATTICAIFLGCLAFAAPASGMGEPSLVRNIAPGTASSSPSWLAPLDGRLYFSADDGVHGSELWSSDGTTAGTSLFKDIVVGSGSSFPIGMTDAFGELAFRATHPDHGAEPWASDGTSAGTALVTDIVPGPVTSDPVNLALGDSRSYFQADDGTTGRELWVYHGTGTETTLVKDLNPGGDPGVHGQMLAVGDTVYFGGDDGTGLKLWRSNGTAAGTAPVSDDVFIDLKPHVWRDGKLFFAATIPAAGSELWVYDAAEGEATMLEDVVSGPSWGLPLLESVVAVDGTILFTAEDGPATTLWRTDGTPDGTTQVEDGMGMLGALTVAGGVAYFAGGDGTSGVELWRSDGTAAGTRIVADIDDGLDSSIPEQLTAIGDRLFFSGNDGEHGYELWTSDGTEAGTEMVADVAGGADSSSPTDITEAGGNVFFVADTDAAGRELWSFPLDIAPVAVNDSTTVAEDAAATAIPVLANDTDADGGAPKSVASVTQPANGEVVVTGGGSGVTYEPDPDYCNAGGATDDFAYELSPGGDVALVKVTVTCADDAPVAVGDSATVAEDAAATAIPVLANDTDADGGAPKSVASVTQPANGEVLVTGGGTGLTYRPDAGYCNTGGPTDDFTYRLSPGGSTATVAVRVTCVDDPPDEPEPPDPPEAGTAFAGRSAEVFKGVARLRLRCRGEGACKGRATLAVRVRRGGRRVRVVLGSKRFSIAAGEAKMVRIRLNRTGRSRLAATPAGRLRVKLAGSGVEPRTVVLTSG